MAAGALCDDLLSLPGVERADVDGAGSSPTGIRVRLATGTDPIRVGEQVRRVLAAHGLRSELVGASADATRKATAADSMVIDDTESAHAAPPSDAASADPAALADGTTRVEPAAAHHTRVSLETVAVVESSEGTTVTVTGVGTTASVRAASSARHALDQAIVAAVAGLAGESEPLVRSVEERDIGDTTVATVVVDAGGERLAGSAVVGGGWAYALGRAAWAAFSSRATSGGIS